MLLRAVVKMYQNERLAKTVINLRTLVLMYLAASTGSIGASSTCAQEPAAYGKHQKPALYPINSGGGIFP